MRNKTFGSALIIAGTSLGAGMIAMPLATAVIGFEAALLIILAIWLLATWSGLLVAEVCRLCPDVSSLYGAAGKVLGRPGQLLTALATLCLPYALCAAYISGASGHLHGGLEYWFNIDISFWICAFIVTGLFAAIIVVSTGSVDMVTRFLFLFKVAMLVLLIGLLLPRVESSNLTSGLPEKQLWLAALPLFFTSFGFQATVPSIVRYVDGDPKKYRPALLLGSVLPLLVYLLWLLATNGVLPQEALVALHEQRDPVSALVIAISDVSGSSWVAGVVNGFASLALATSFLGVALGLFDYLAEAFKRTNSLSGRVQTAAITFIPPLLVSLYFPDSFISALGFAAVALVVLAVFLPVAMAWKLNSKLLGESQFMLYGKPVLSVAVLFGLIISFAQLGMVVGVLPSVG